MNNENKLLNMKPEEILEFLNKKSKPRIDVIPDGWYTIKQLGSAWGTSNSTTGRKVRCAVEDGLMEQRMFVITSLGGTTRGVAHFKVKVQ